VREELIQTINTELNNLQNQIQDNQKNINELNQNLEKLKKEYARMVYFAFRNKDSYSKMMFVFAATDFNQAYQRLKYIQSYNDFRKKQAEQIAKTKKEISQKIDQLNVIKTEKSSLLSSEEQEKTTLSKEKEEQVGVLSQIQVKEKQLKTQLEQKKKDAEALNAAIKKIIQEELERQREEERKRLLAEKSKKESTKKKKEGKEKEGKRVTLELTKEAEELSADFSSNKGKLPWPVQKGVITDRFGQHEHASIKGFIVNNNGVDISTTRGASCRSVFAGEVTGVTSVPGIGKLIIVRHGEFLTVYSNLSEVFVRTGEKVSVKQSLGSISYNDDEERTVLNLQIWKGQKILNPEEWLFR
jgi:septal ring factor EnvC (AmiA/AmiB activator)